MGNASSTEVVMASALLDTNSPTTQRSIKGRSWSTKSSQQSRGYTSMASADSATTTPSSWLTHRSQSRVIRRTLPPRQYETDRVLTQKLSSGRTSRPREVRLLLGPTRLPLALEAATRASNVSRGHWFGEAIQPAIWARELKPSLLRMPRTMGNVNDTPPAMFEVFGVWGLLAIP